MINFLLLGICGLGILFLLYRVYRFIILDDDEEYEDKDLKK